MATPGEVLQFVGRNARRVGVTVLGVVLLVGGLVMMVTPGPGLLGVIAGLAVLATEYAWARRALAKAKGQARRLRLRSRKHPRS